MDKKINKILIISLSTLLITANIANVNATSGALRENSIKECNGKKYGQHGKDNHWHQAEYTPRDKGSDYTAIGQPFYSDPCTLQKVDTKTNNNTQSNDSSTSKNNSNNTNSNTKANNNNNKTSSSNKNNTNISSKVNSSTDKNNSETKKQTNTDKVKEDNKQTDIDKTNEINNVVKETSNDSVINNTEEENNTTKPTNNEEKSNIFDVIIGSTVLLGIATVGGGKFLKK